MIGYHATKNSNSNAKLAMSRLKELTPKCYYCF